MAGTAKQGETRRNKEKQGHGKFANFCLLIEFQNFSVNHPSQNARSQNVRVLVSAILADSHHTNTQLCLQSESSESLGASVGGLPHTDASGRKAQTVVGVVRAKGSPLYFDVILLSCIE